MGNGAKDFRASLVAPPANKPPVWDGAVEFKELVTVSGNSASAPPSRPSVSRLASIGEPARTGEYTFWPSLTRCAPLE